MVEFEFHMKDVFFLEELGCLSLPSISRERRKEGGREGEGVCVCERERERER